MHSRTRLIPCLGVIALAAPLARGAHNHLTVDTTAGQCVIRAGYLAGETAYTISAGRLLKSGQIAVYNLTNKLTTGPLTGWYASNEVLLTSDFYFATGRLDNGDFGWELAAVTPVSGTPPTGSLAAWGVFDSGTGAFIPSGVSNGASRPARSFGTPPGDHNHAQGYAFSTYGVYDLTFIVWDANSVYTDSTPVTVRFNVVPPPCPTDLNGDRTINTADLTIFLARFGSSASGPANGDFNNDGVVNTADLTIFLASFGTPCP